MNSPANLVSQLMNAFELANIEALAVLLPEATVAELTTAAIRKWNCARSDIVGRQLVKYGTGTISARYLSASPGEATPDVEVTYAPPLAVQRTSKFKQQQWSDGTQNYMVLIGQHASEEHANESIRNEQRLNLALRSGGYAVWDYDYVTGETYSSPELYEVLGFDQANINLDFHTFNARVHPDDQDKTLDKKIEAATFGTELFQTRYRVRMKNNEYVWIDSVACVVRDPANGKALKCVGLCRNVNDQMAALERMRNSERNLKRTQEAARLGSFSLRIETNVSRLSTEMASLIGMEEAIVHPNLTTFMDMIEEGSKEKFAEGIELAKLGQHIADLEISVRLKSGDIEFFQCTIEPERNSTGQVETLFGSCQCVTERKALERKYLQAQKMEAVGQLTGGVAHDFNNLLMVVMGNLQLVEQLVKNDERATKRIRAALEAADKGSDLTKRMLAFSRQQTLQNKELSVNELLFKMTDMLKHAVSATVEVKIMPSENLWPVKADQTMLETAILNLAINARDAMKPKGGNLIIETANRHLDQAYCAEHEDVSIGDYVEIAVTDTGSGISPENIEKVFQPFFTTKGPEAGSGLGLSMIYGFVKQTSGHIKIYSEVDHGTTVKIYLPCFKSNANVASIIKPGELQSHLARELGISAEDATNDQQAVKIPAKKQIVLVVEDNNAVRDIAAAMIEEMGFETLVASNGPEGLEIIKTRDDLALVLSDVIMAGGMNGPELAAKALKFRPDLKVLFMSGYAPGSVRQMQDLPDTIDFVNKPFTRNDLTEKVRRALAA
jgi:nitrogen-specific signal transduction histidine kinase/CheY-like chemotaxis protein